MEDPQFVVLVIVNDPEGGGFGGTTAGPAVHDIVSELLRYYNIKPEYTDEDLSKINNERVTLPKLNGMYASEAEGILLAEGLKYSVQGAARSKEFKVKDQ